MPPCNILLVSLDTVRADHLGCYGYRRATSPHLDRLAGEGVVFETCLAPHIPTYPAHTTLFSGTDVFAHRIVGQHRGDGAPTCADELPLLAERLQAAGYFTAAADNLGRWFRRGFSEYRQYAWDKPPRGPWRKAEAVTQAALAALDDCLAQDRPWLLFVHYWDAHTPYLPPPPFDRMFYSGDECDPANHGAERMWATYDALRDYFRSWLGELTDIDFPAAQYDAALAYQDACLQHLWSRLRASGQLDRTLLAVTADHGEELTEHDMWYDHHGLYETNLHVPLILRHGDLPRGERRGGMVTHLDLAPTLLDLAGVPPDGHLRGAGLRPLLDTGDDSGTTKEVYLTESTWMKKYGWRTPRYKLIVDLEDPHHHTPPVELYDLDADPGEQHNLAVERPDLVVALRADCERHRAQRLADTGRADPLDEVDLAFRRL